MYPGSTAIILNCSSLFLSYHPIPEREDTRPNRLYYDSTWDIMMHTFMTLEKQISKTFNLIAFPLLARIKDSFH